MIDPLRPYWPTNRSIAGLLVRGLCLLVAAAAVVFGASRYFVFLVVLLAAISQASLLTFEWMELKRTHRSGLTAGGIVVFLFLSLVVVLVIESRSVLTLSVR
jgi:predicted ABC-type exoprotein transport system permease subunit